MNYRVLKLIPLLAFLGNASAGCVSPATNEKERILVGHTVDVKSVAFSPDGKTLASAGYSHDTDRKWAGEIKLWDIASGRERITLRGQKGAAFVAFSPDGRTLASGGYYPDTDNLDNNEKNVVSEIRLWDIASGEERATFKERLESVVYSAFAISPDGKLLAMGTDEGVKIWDVAERGEPLLFKTDRPKTLTFSPDSKVLAVGSSRSSGEIGRLLASWEVKLIDVRTGKEQLSFKGSGDDAFVNSVVSSLDGRVLAAGSADGTIRLWDLLTKKEMTIRDESSYSIGRVTCIALSPNHKILASSNGNGVITLWDVDTGHQLATFKRQDEWINSVVFSPDGKTIAWGSSVKTIALSDVSGMLVKRPMTKSQ